MASGKIWNGRATGLPSALAIGIGILFRRLSDLVVTLGWRGNLGALGRGSRIQSGVRIRFPGNVEIGSRSSVARGTLFMTEMSDGFCRIGSDVIISTDVQIDFSGGLEIGDNVVVSERAALFTHAHGLDPKSVPDKAPLMIEPDVWIGASVIAIEGVGRIGRGSVIASGTVLTKEVPPRSLVAGVPGRVIRSLA